MAGVRVAVGSSFDVVVDALMVSQRRVSTKSARSWAGGFSSEKMIVSQRQATLVQPGDGQYRLNQVIRLCKISR